MHHYFISWIFCSDDADDTKDKPGNMWIKSPIRINFEFEKELKRLIMEKIPEDFLEEALYLTSINYLGEFPQ